LRRSRDNAERGGRIHAVDHGRRDQDRRAALFRGLIDDVHGAELQGRRTAGVEVGGFDEFLCDFLFGLTQQDARQLLALRLRLPAHCVLQRRGHADIADFDREHGHAPFRGLAPDFIAKLQVALLAVGQQRRQQRGVTPEIHQEAIAIADAYDRGGVFTPPSQRGTIQVPGNAGGASWTGAAVDPDTHTLYVPTFRLPITVTIRKPEAWQGSYDFIGLPKYLPGPRGLPLLKPPFGSIVAIDMNSGEQRWRIPVGRSVAMPAVQKVNPSGNYGLMARSWAMITKTVMVVVQMGYFSSPRFQPGVNRPIRDLHNLDPHLWVYDKTTGSKLAEIELPSNATGAPITYMAGGRQFIVFPVGGGPVTEELIAVGL